MAATPRRATTVAPLTLSGARPRWGGTILFRLDRGIVADEITGVATVRFSVRAHLLAMA